MEKRLENFVFAVRAMAYELDFKIDCAMIAVKDRASGKRTMLQIDGGVEKATEKRKNKKNHQRLPRK